MTDETPDGAVRAEAPLATPAPASRASRPAAADDEDLDVPPPTRAPRANPFGSVWDSQLGTPSASSAASRAPLVDEEDFEEPEIPEYLIAEQRRSGNRGGAGGGRGARGGRSAYQSAMERERYGRGGGGGGINRYPDVSGRTQQAPPPREDRGRGRSDRPASAPVARGSNEPWSDVPPELEALLRAQVAQKPAPGRPAQTTAPTSEPVIDRDGEAVEGDAIAAGSTAPKARATRKPAAAKATSTKTAAKPRATRKPAAATADAVGADRTADAAATADAPAKPAAKPRATRKPAAKADATVTGDGDAAPAAAPKRRTTRKVAAPAEPV